LVMILVDNAIKFTPAGGRVDVSIGVQAGAPVVTVTDTGPGIAASELPHIFERFYRSDRARTREGQESAAAGGAGLGLSIAQWIADAHQAVLSVRSRPGEGTTFTVRFPTLPAPGPVSLS